MIRIEEIGNGKDIYRRSLETDNRRTKVDDESSKRYRRRSDYLYPSQAGGKASYQEIKDDLNRRVEEDIYTSPASIRGNPNLT